MAIQVKEVHKFDKGIHGSVSELDISPESASLSLNIDPNSEYGALRGIQGDKILSEDGWETPRYAKWGITFFGDVNGLIPKTTLEKKLFLINAYDKSFLLVFTFDNSKVQLRFGGTGTDIVADFEVGNNIGIHSDLFDHTDDDEYTIANNDSRNFNVIPVLLEDKLTDANKIKAGHIADAVKIALNYAYPSSTLQAVSGYSSYFYCYRPSTYATQEELDVDGTLSILSNFYGDISIPRLPTESFDNGANISGTSLGHTSGLYLPDSDLYSTNSTYFIKGSGLAQIQTLDGINSEETTDFNFLKLKAFNSKDSSNILAITKTAQVKLFQNLEKSGSISSSDLGSISISSENSLSIEQRNKNLYLGAGDYRGTSSMWIGFIERNQIGKQLSGYYLEENNLKSISDSVGANNFDNIVVPTLHHGLNNTNGGIAGAASLYADALESGSNDDLYKGDIVNGGHFRSVNGWVKQCLKNNAGSSAGDYDHYNDVKEGMIFRVNLGYNYVAGNYTGNHTPSVGKSAQEYLYALKEIAKGKIEDSTENKTDEPNIEPFRGGSGETLHDGDLFQVVYSSGEDEDIDLSAIDDSNMFRLVYIGTLHGKAATGTAHPSYANSTDAYCGIPAYAYAHTNDNSKLIRIKTTSKSDASIAELHANKGGIYTEIKDTHGLGIKFSPKRLETIDLKVELGVTDFEISTMSECKSSDGAGGFGGDIGTITENGVLRNKNYFTGHGKLWVANKNEPFNLYLIDVTNWDNQNVIKPRISFKKISLVFDRIHKTLLSDNNTNYGKGLVRLTETVDSGEADLDKEKSYFTGYEWNPLPEGQYISSICETYSHLPHMGDGAGGGAANGDGKWRVWVEYKKNEDLAHIRYDLFLFNFRPQPWVGSGNDKGEGITSSSTQVYMFDKTPPNQECQKVTMLSLDKNQSRKAIYYPFDKMVITKKGAQGTNDLRISGQTNDMNIDYGSDYIGQGKGNTDTSEKYCHNDHIPNDSAYSLKFRNPSGEFRGLYAPDKEYESWTAGQRFACKTATLPLGHNIGWLLGSPREYTPVRHTLNPYYRKWYFTGNTSSGTGVNQIPYPDEENYKASGKKTLNAHVVSSFGKLTGKFVRHAGTLVGGKRIDTNLEFMGEKCWCAYEEGVLKHFGDEYTVFNMHDSPVAIESYNGTAYEVQGKPATSVGNETVELADNPDVDRFYYSDTEAGFMGSRSADGNSTADAINHSSVPATMGYSKYNQYRFHHANNGTADLTNDDGNGESESYITGKTYGYGGQYFGKDSFGHYTNITQTWASNQDYLLQGSKPEDVTIKSTTDFPQHAEFEHVRGFGWGDGAQFKENNVRSSNGLYWSGTPYPAQSGSSPTERFSKHGTGYFTYQANTDSVDTTDTSKSGFYSSTTNVDNDSTFIIPGKQWDNRRVVHCWSVTALTDSIHNYSYNTARDVDNLFDHREFGLWKTPRCSFRKLEIPGFFGNNAKIMNIDTISWSERNVNEPNPNTDSTNDNTFMKSGYLVQFACENGDINDTDTSSTGVVVYETKTSSFYSTNMLLSSDRIFGDSNPYAAHSLAATDVLRAVHRISDLSKIDTSIFRQFMHYKNNKLITKNLVPGLSDTLTSTQTDSAFERHNEQLKPFKILHERYSPLVLSHGGSENKEEIGIWVRAQFNSPDEASQDVIGLGGFPYYKCDKLWNYWSQYNSKGFDRSTSNFNSANYITEGWGSTSGSGTDEQYPFSYSNINSENQLKTKDGAHIKSSNSSILEKEAEIETNDAAEFPEGKVLYKFSLLYDGFQESPLNKNALEINVTANSSMLRLKLTVPSLDFMGVNARVTHINVYRKNKTEDLYRLVKSVSLDLSKENWANDDNEFILRFNDEQRLSSYEGLNGIPESLTNLTPNYRLSCQLNDFLFVGGLHHPNLEDGDHLLLRSKQGRFSVFDWSNDFLDIPTKPVAMAAFANRVWIFDNNNMYKINPTGLYIEDKTEGIGILNSESFIVTDMGMFWCDRSNIYKHDGTKINQIGTSILKNHSHPEWQIGYLDAVNKSEILGYTPKIGYDSINQCIYVTLQGFSKSLLSYKKYDSRIYSYDIKQDRWDYYDSPAVKSLTTDNSGSVIMSDGFQLYNYRRDKKNPKKFSWDSKTFQLGSSNYTKSLKTLKFTGDICLWNFNNGVENRNFISDTGGDIVYEEPDFETTKDGHVLETSIASETDDLKVYVDGILQTMRIKSRNPVIGSPIANDSTGEIYALDQALPSFETKSGTLTYKDSFSITNTSCPEFLTWPNGQFEKVTLEGELSELMHIHKGMYLYFKGIDINGITQEEIVRVRDIKFTWEQLEGGKNTLSGPVEIRTWRGQLGTKSYNWSNSELMPPLNINPIKTASPTLLFPRGIKGKTVKISLQNQKSFIDSFAISYRVKKFK